MASLQRGILDKIVGALCTRSGGTVQATRAALKDATVEQWGRVRVLPDGDTIKAATFTTAGESRDASWVRVRLTRSSPRSSLVPIIICLQQYEALVDRNARARNRAIELVPRTFYGQLQHIYVVYCPAIASSTHTTPSSVVFAVIRTCDVIEDHPQLDIHYYTRESTLDVVDITTVQCLVGRFQDRARWAIIDRSGSLSRAWYVGDDEEDTT